MSRRSLFLDPLGFTMTELMVTVAVLGVITAVVIPYSTALLRREQVNAAAQDLAGWLDQVRKASLRRTGAGCAVSFASTGDLNAGAVLAEITPGSDCISVIPQPQLRLPSAAGNSQFAIAASATTLQFTPRGTATNTTNITIGINLKGSSPQRCVQISSLIGFIRIGVNNTSSSPSGTCDYGNATSI